MRFNRPGPTLLFKWKVSSNKFVWFYSFSYILKPLLPRVCHQKIQIKGVVEARPLCIASEKLEKLHKVVNVVDFYLEPSFSPRSFNLKLHAGPKLSFYENCLGSHIWDLKGLQNFEQYISNFDNALLNGNSFLEKPFCPMETVGKA